MLEQSERLRAELQEFKLSGEADREVQIRGKEGLSLGCGKRQDLERTHRIEGGLVEAFDTEGG